MDEAIKKLFQQNAEIASIYRYKKCAFYFEAGCLHVYNLFLIADDVVRVNEQVATLTQSQSACFALQKLSFPLAIYINDIFIAVLYKPPAINSAAID